MFSAACMAGVMAALAACIAVDTHASGIVAAVMIFLYQSFYTWGFMGGLWVCSPACYLFKSSLSPFHHLLLTIESA